MQTNKAIADEQLQAYRQRVSTTPAVTDIAVLVGAALLAIGIGFFLARSIAGSAGRMARAAQEIADVDLANLVAVTQALAAWRPDAVGGATDSGSGGQLAG